MPSIKIINGLDPEMEGYQTQQQLAAIFEGCLNLAQRKHRTYGDAFRSQGYMGNVARVLSKAARLKNMVWNDFGQQIDDTDESVLDTMYDLINLSAFFIINWRDRNKWGS